MNRNLAYCHVVQHGGILYFKDQVSFWDSGCLSQNISYISINDTVYFSIFGIIFVFSSNHEEGGIYKHFVSIFKVTKLVLLLYNNICIWWLLDSLQSPFICATSSILTIMLYVDTEVYHLHFVAPLVEKIFSIKLPLHFVKIRWQGL